jgi:hypoxia up-regulated 1
VAEKIEKLKGTNECYDPTVKVSVKLTDAGLVQVLHSEVQCEIREKKNLADKFKGLFGGGGKDKETKEDQIVFEGSKDEKSSSPISSSAAGSSSTASVADTAEKVRYEKAALRVSVVDESPVYLSPEQKSESKKLYPLLRLFAYIRLVALDQLDRDRAAREEALNSLEAYIYRSRDFLEDELFEKVSSDGERKSFKEKLEAASEWLFSSESVTYEDFKSKLTELTYFP